MLFCCRIYCGVTPIYLCTDRIKTYLCTDRIKTYLCTDRIKTYLCTDRIYYREGWHWGRHGREG
jgi:hypothetical protein